MSLISIRGEEFRSQESGVRREQALTFQDLRVRHLGHHKGASRHSSEVRRNSGF
jgi:hypothetical protein